VLHNLAELDLDPAAAGIDVVVSGHSHRPKIEAVDGVLYLNPGSAGPRRSACPLRWRRSICPRVRSGQPSWKLAENRHCRRVTSAHRRAEGSCVRGQVRFGPGLAIEVDGGIRSGRVIEVLSRQHGRGTIRSNGNDGASGARF